MEVSVLKSLDPFVFHVKIHPHFSLKKYISLERSSFGSYPLSDSTSQKGILPASPSGPEDKGKDVNTKNLHH